MNEDKITLSYIETLDDEEELKDIVFSNSDIECQTAAAKRIENEDILEKIIFTGRFENDVRIAALANLKSEELLKKAIYETYDFTIQRHAILNPNFNDEMELARIAYENMSLANQETALEKLKALYPDSIYLYTDEIENIDDNEILYEIAKNSVYFDSRAKAIENIHDREILLEITTGKFDSRLAKFALKNLDLEDEETFERIFSSSDNMRLREYITENLTDESMLEHIALNDEETVVIVTAIENPNFKSEYALNQLARSDVGDYAINKILIHPLFKNQEIIDEIICGVHTHETTRLAAGMTQNSSVLVDLALNSSDWEIREAALNNPYFKDEEVLRRIIDGEVDLQFVRLANRDIKVAAIKNPNFKDEKRLKDFAVNSPVSEFRSAAAINPNLKDKELLLDLAINERNGDVAKAAANNPNLSDKDKQQIILKGFHYFYFEKLTATIEDKEVLENIITSINENKVHWDKGKEKPSAARYNPLSALGLDTETKVKWAAEEKLKSINPI